MSQATATTGNQAIAQVTDLLGEISGMVEAILQDSSLMELLVPAEIWGAASDDAILDELERIAREYIAAE